MDNNNKSFLDILTSKLNTMKKFSFVFYLILFIPLLANAQSVEVTGSLKVSSVATDNTAAFVVVRLADGTFAVRDAASFGAVIPNGVSFGEFLYWDGTEWAIGSNEVKIGSFAGSGNQGANAVAIGLAAGGINQRFQAVAIGGGAGGNNQGSSAVAIGGFAGDRNQGIFAVAIGDSAGGDNQGSSAVAVGFEAGQMDQSDNAVAIGASAGVDNQGSSAVAIGQRAGDQNQGSSAVAIGAGAGSANQDNNSIIINASGNDLNSTGSNGLFIKPVRGVAHGLGVGVLHYDPTTGEITYSID